MFAVDQQHLELAGAGSFCGFLARHGRELFRDEDFAGLYCADNSRNSVPPGVLSLALLLQAHDRVSDAEATAQAVFDLRWKVALALALEARPLAAGDPRAGAGDLPAGLQFARQTGYLKGRRMKAAVDTTTLLGRGAVEDTHGLIGHGIAKLGRVLGPLASTVVSGGWRPGTAAPGPAVSALPSWPVPPPDLVHLPARMVGLLDQPEADAPATDPRWFPGASDRPAPSRIIVVRLRGDPSHGGPPGLLHVDLSQLPDDLLGREPISRHQTIPC